MGDPSDLVAPGQAPGSLLQYRGETGALPSLVLAAGCVVARGDVVPGKVVSRYRGMRAGYSGIGASGASTMSGTGRA